jgi:hypothetical protein
MAINLSNLTFTEQDDVVPVSGVEQIFNTGIANTLAGNDIINGRSEGTSEGLTYSFRNYGTLNTSEGNDILTGTLNDSYGFALSAVAIYNNGAIDTGDGNDIITGIIEEADQPSYAIFSIEGTIDTGDGNDIITGISQQGTGILNWDSNINTGDGDDTITGISNAENGDGLHNDGTINTGNNDDSIISHGKFLNSGWVFLGEGNDSIAADTDFSDRALENFGFIGTGDGNDTITSTGVIYNEGVIETGNGDDSIIVDGGFDDLTGTTYSIYNNGGAINMGDGNDSIIANEGFESGFNSSGAWFLGEGEDYIKGFGSGDFYGGNGNDILELTPGSYTVGIWGEGDTSVIFTKGNSLMITSEFEQLIAGGTTYNFVSLTAGQTIVVA